MSNGRSGCGCGGCLSAVFSLFFLWVFLVWFGGCTRFLLMIPGSAHRKELAESAAQTYYARINEGKCQEIYDQASKGFKRRFSQQTVLEGCERTRQYLGANKSTQLVASGFGFDHEGDYIELTYDITYSNSSRQERLIWRIENNQPVLDSHLFDNKSTPPSPTSVVQ